MVKKIKKFPVYSFSTQKLLGEAPLPSSLLLTLDSAIKPLSVATTTKEDCDSFYDSFGEVEQIAFDTKEEKIWIQTSKKKKIR